MYLNKLKCDHSVRFFVSLSVIALVLLQSGCTTSTKQIPSTPLATVPQNVLNAKVATDNTPSGKWRWLEVIQSDKKSSYKLYDNGVLREASSPLFGNGIDGTQMQITPGRKHGYYGTGNPKNGDWGFDKILIYNIDGRAGRITRSKLHPIQLPCAADAIAIDPAGCYMYVNEKAGRMEVFRIGRDGDLTKVATTHTDDTLDMGAPDMQSDLDQTDDITISSDGRHLWIHQNVSLINDGSSDGWEYRITPSHELISISDDIGGSTPQSDELPSVDASGKFVTDSYPRGNKLTIYRKLPSGKIPVASIETGVSSFAYFPKLGVFH
jgi:hypothetical protein